MLLTGLVLSLLAGPLPETCTLSGTVKIDERTRSWLGNRPMVVFVEKAVTSATSRANRGRQELHQRGLKFDPPVTVLLSEETLSFINDDKVEHGVFASGKDVNFDIINSDPKTHEQTFHKEGYTHIQCDIHEWMSADLLVVQNPYFAFVAADGTWSIPALPWRAEDYRLRAWEPNGGREVEPVDVRCGPDAQPRPLTLTVEVKPKPKPRHKNRQPFQHDRGPIYTQPGN
jgi:plastocyanin